jgi:hypothetical protein
MWKKKFPNIPTWLCISYIILGILWFFWQIFMDELAGLIRDHIPEGGVIMYSITHPYIIMPLLLILVSLYLLWRQYKGKKQLKSTLITDGANYEIKNLGWVTCDKCGFIGVRNIKTRELEEMEDNQRRTGQPVLIRINQLGDTEPRHEKIPECIMQMQDFSINPPLSSHALPLFYMQLSRQCQHYKEWQKGLTPKEHLTLSKTNRIEQLKTEIHERATIHNRDALFRVMSEVRQTSYDLLTAQERLDEMNTRSPHLVHTEEMQEVEDAYNKYKNAMNRLDAEILVAGKDFETLLSDLSAFISTQVMLKGVKPKFINGDANKQHRILSALEYSARIANKIREVTQKIDEISKQGDGKKGSQT